MRRLLIGMVMAGGLAAASSAPAREKLTDEQQLAKMTQGLVPGPPQNCLLSRSSATSSDLTAVGTRLIYRFGRNLVYVNQTAGGCERVARDDILVTRSFGSGLCRGDIARTVSRTVPNFTTGSCALGPFVPYRRP